MQRELRRVEEQQHNVVNAIGHTSGKAVVTLVEELDRLEQERVTLQTRLEQWQFMQDCAVTEDGLLRVLTDQRERLLRGTPQEQKSVVQLFVERVTVTTERFTVDYVIKTSGLPDDCVFKWWRMSTPSRRRRKRGIFPRPGGSRTKTGTL